MIIDYSRRTDPACQEGVVLFKKQLHPDTPPKVVHFWTKAAAAYIQLIGAGIRPRGVMVVPINVYTATQNITLVDSYNNSPVF